MRGSTKFRDSALTLCVDARVIARITAQSADTEIAHFKQVIRSSARRVALNAVYWRGRIEHLQQHAELLPQQRARLDAIMRELDGHTSRV